MMAEKYTSKMDVREYIELSGATDIDFILERGYNRVVLFFIYSF